MSARKAAPRGDIAGAGTRLDHRGAFPVLPDALVVGERGVGRDRDLGGRRVGPQAQIDTEHVAVGGPLLQELHEAAGQPQIERRRFDVGHEGRRFRIEQDDEIDIARIVQLERAHLAHGEHDQAAARFRMRGIAGSELAALDRAVEQEAHRGRERRIGERGERSRHPHHRPDPADVGERDQEGCFLLHAPQERASPPPRPACAATARGGVGDERREARVRIGLSTASRRAGSALARSHRNGERRPAPRSGRAPVRRRRAGPSRHRGFTVDVEQPGGDLPARLRRRESDGAATSRAARSSPTGRSPSGPPSLRPLTRLGRHPMESPVERLPISDIAPRGDGHGRSGAGRDGRVAGAVLQLRLGSTSIALRPGALSSSSSSPRCRRATAAARLRPSPAPGSVRLCSSRTKRSTTRLRSSGNAGAAIGDAQHRVPSRTAAPITIAAGTRFLGAVRRLSRRRSAGAACSAPHT